MSGPDARFVIRPAVPADVPALAAVHLASWLATYRGIIADDYLDSLDRQTFEGYHRPRFKGGAPEPDQPFVVACERASGAIVGFARGGPTRRLSPTGDPLPPESVEPFSAELYAIYLLPSYQGRGAGAALCREVARRLLELHHLSLCVWVLDQNVLGRRFYERMGGALVPTAAHVTLGGIPYAHLLYGWSDLRRVAAAPPAPGPAKWSPQG